MLEAPTHKVLNGQSTDLAAQFGLGTVLSIDEIYSVVLVDMKSMSEPLPCVCLDSIPAARVAAGDRVMVWHSGVREDPGVVIGRVQTLLQPTRREPGDQPPASLTLEATEELTLRVGDGSITIRRDGKILIKGKDLVSHAQRVNRIKGGSVSIN